MEILETYLPENCRAGRHGREARKCRVVMPRRSGRMPDLSGPELERLLERCGSRALRSSGPRHE